MVIDPAVTTFIENNVDYLEDEVSTSSLFLICTLILGSDSLDR